MAEALAKIDKKTNAGLAQGADADCDLVMSKENLSVQMENFSRTLDTAYFTAAKKIADKLKTKLPMVSTYEVMDKAFSFPRVRQYNIVTQEMSNIEMFQDNLNQNLSNTVAFKNFLHYAKAAKKVIADRYNSGEFVDPADNLAELK